MFRYSRQIHKIYEMGSFTKAAEHLYITQPALSVIVRKVEDALGETIFLRTNPVTLTAFGERYINAVEEFFRLEDRLKTHLSLNGQEPSGSLTIIYTNLSAPSFVTRQLVVFQKTHPNVHLRLRSYSTGKAKEQLDNGQADFIITNQPYDAVSYTQQLCGKEQLLLAIPKQIELPKQMTALALSAEELTELPMNTISSKAIDLGVLDQLPFIALSRGNYLRACTDLIFQEEKVYPRQNIETDSSTDALTLCSLGAGATIVSHHLISSSDHNSLRCFLPKNQYTQRAIYLTAKRTFKSTPAKSAFSQFMVQAR